MEVQKSTMRFFNKNPVNPYAVIIYVSFILFLLRIYACRYVLPEFTGMDYYGYVELGKNIFHRLDFIVNWELDSPIQYPPLFPILVYLLTCLTKNAVASILWINIFSASFYLVPLFSLVRNMLNTYFAVLAVVFATYYFGIKPCYLLNMDFFYSFLVIIICWFVWDTLTHRSRQAWRYVLAGILIGLADLTKYSGMLFCWASLGSILYYFARHQHSIKTGFKFCVFLFLGTAPLIMAYHLVLNNNLKGKGHVPSISAYTFFDGNYMYEKGLDYREEKISELNSKGTEFSYVSLLKTDNELKFSLRNPLFVLDKYMWGLNIITQDVTFTVFPDVGAIAKSRLYSMPPDGGKVFRALMGNGYTGILKESSVTEAQINQDNHLKEDAVRKAAGVNFDKVWDILQQSLSFRTGINFIFQWAFLLLLIISGAYFKWHLNMMHVLFFTIGMAFIPFYLIHERYLMPFMPLYFVLLLFILNAGYCYVKTVTTNKIILRYLALVVFTFLVSVYSANSCKQIYPHCKYFRQQVKQNEMQLQTALWIKKDSRGLAHRVKIMPCHDNYLSYLTDSDYIHLPYLIVNWNKVINFASLKNVDYIVIEGDYVNSFLTFSADEFRRPLTSEALLSAINAGKARMEEKARHAALQGTIKKNRSWLWDIVQWIIDKLTAVFRNKPELLEADKGGMDKLASHIDDSNSNVRQAALQTMGIIAKNRPELLSTAKGIVDKVVASMDDRNSDVRQAAVQTLGIITQQRPDLLDTVKDIANKAYVPPAGIPTVIPTVARTPIELLNELLVCRDLYKAMPIWPVGSIHFIHRLKKGEPLNSLEIKQLNRLLIEANYPKEAPHKLWLDFKQDTGSLRIKMVHEINTDDDTVLILKI